MAITFPLSVAALADKLKIKSVIFDIKRNDEMSGSGDGRLWQAELAPPLWTAEISLRTDYNDALKQIAAIIRKLNGSQEAFYLYDPISKYPQYDPTGSILSGASPAVLAIAAGRNALSLNFLPANYRITLGDKLCIPYGSPVKYAFVEASETVTANGSGVTGMMEIFPNLPIGLGAGGAVILSKPFCKMILMPGTHNPGTAQLPFTENASFQAIQKK